MKRFDADENETEAVVVDLTDDDSRLLAHIAVAQVAAMSQEDPWDEEVFEVRRSSAARH